MTKDFNPHCSFMKAGTVVKSFCPDNDLIYPTGSIGIILNAPGKALPDDELNSGSNLVLVRPGVDFLVDIQEDDPLMPVGRFDDYDKPPEHFDALFRFIAESDVDSLAFIDPFTGRRALGAHVVKVTSDTKAEALYTITVDTKGVPELLGPLIPKESNVSPAVNMSEIVSCEIINHQFDLKVDLSPENWQYIFNNQDRLDEFVALVLLGDTHPDHFCLS